jgi:putative transposase
MAKRTRYHTDCTDAEWRVIGALIPAAKPGGRPEQYPKREIVNAIRYLVRTGCPWRLLPHDFPPYRIVYHYFRTWRTDGTWERVHDTLRRRARKAAGRDPEPSAGLLDSQSVKVTDQAGPRGFDAGKQVKGRKRHLLVDTLGLLLAVVVTAASVQDRDGAKCLLHGVVGRLPRLAHLWADGAYGGDLIAWVARTCGWILEIVQRPANAVGFVLLPRRWVVERTFGWLGHFRRLRKDYEVLPEPSAALIRIAMIGLMVHRLARRRTN